MPVSYTIEGEVLHLVMHGEYGPEEIRSRVEEALADPRLPHDVHFLFDTRPSTSLASRSTAELRDVAGFLGARSQAFGGRLAMLASEPLHFGLLRMAEVYSEFAGLQARAFYDEFAALAWLGVER